ncbi:MAG: glycosyltransferase [Oscillospiraceae bacterium]|nr:glycosyltransferase [Oscillospiraceae bacterium]
MECWNTEEPLVSVIVPVYNAQLFLRACLDSLLRQELTSYEILCINDGSTDASGEILNEYACKYPQVRHIYQENAGVSAARNKGLSMARGTYVSFCDSDDFLKDGLLGLVARHMIERDATVGLYHEIWVGEDYSYDGSHVSADAEVTVGIDEYVSNVVQIVQMLIKRTYLQQHGVSFNRQISYAEDALFMVDIMRHMLPEKVIHIHQEGYYHRNNSASAMNANKTTRIPRHYQSMRLLAKELQHRLVSEEGIMHPVVESHMRSLLNIAVCNAMHDGFFLLDRSPEDILRQLREDGIYPQPFNWKYLKIRNPREMAYNYLRFFFPVPLYYSIVSRLIRVVLKLKNR